MNSPIKLRYLFGAAAGAVLAVQFANHDLDETSRVDHPEATGTLMQTAPDIVKPEPAPNQPDASQLSAFAPIEAIRPVPRPKHLFPSIAQALGEPENGDIYEIGGKRFTLTEEVKTAFLNVEEQTGIPHGAMIALCARESDCGPSEINGSSGACGLFQLMTNDTQTLYEVVWRYAKAYGYEYEDSLVERYNRNQDDIDAVERYNADKPSRDRKKLPKAVFGYRPVSEDAKTQLIESCKDPLFNTTMWAAYQLPHIDKYNEWLGDRKITAGEVVAMNNLGRVGLQKLARQAWDPKGRDTLAVDFFKAHKSTYGGHMTANTTLIKHADGSYKTVGEAYHDMMKFGGYEALQTVASADLNR